MAASREDAPTRTAHVWLGAAEQRALEDEVRKGTARARVRCDCASHRRLPCLSAQSRAHSIAHLTRLCQGIWKLASMYWCECSKSSYMSC
jgi:hypothetical protein